MNRTLLLRLGDASEETIAALRAHAEDEGFAVTVQARVGRLPIMKKPGFSERWEALRPDVEARRVSLREAARRLGCGAATLSRLLKSDQ